ncbi:unnamed protein product (macronuclear) [Paramecium tetraurelia]|uniref:Mini antigen n=1 Tax=Paramecium tetraurelia TaxID=5888 RepID=A0CAX0_PARTE|nr:uncharacterized protein GSPATT00036718001 [Paramecium tetraurelia]CAK67937.1 unnamed protein product [Paramecium tetraurelia]|eukprot:XP_001435334.1 hypothetical protein (macronuclear) [Paramecium tetraurelia strain d4-2]
MNYGIFIGLIALTNQLLVDHVCSCEQLQSENDCKIGSEQCDWDGFSCSTIQCQSFDSKTEEDCIKFIGCAINDVGNCRPFSDCVDYHVTDPNKCKEKWATCVAGTNMVDGKYECQEKDNNNQYYVCNQIEDRGVCTADAIENQAAIKQADGEVCDWIVEDNVGRCIAYDPNKCSNIISKSKCELFSCRWDSEKEICSEPYCIEITDKTKCTYLRGDQTGTFQICQWDKDQCQDAEDTLFLTKDNCLQSTFFSATWNGTSCNLCQNDGFSTLLSMVIVMVLIL